jgi:hypothetical protein
MATVVAGLARLLVWRLALATSRALGSLSVTLGAMRESGSHPALPARVAVIPTETVQGQLLASDLSTLALHLRLDAILARLLRRITPTASRAVVAVTLAVLVEAEFFAPPFRALHRVVIKVLFALCADLLAVVVHRLARKTKPSLDLRRDVVVAAVCAAPVDVLMGLLFLTFHAQDVGVLPWRAAVHALDGDLNPGLEVLHEDDIRDNVELLDECLLVLGLAHLGLQFDQFFFRLLLRRVPDHPGLLLLLSLSPGHKILRFVEKVLRFLEAA